MSEQPDMCDNINPGPIGAIISLAVENTSEPGANGPPGPPGPSDTHSMKTKGAKVMQEIAEIARLLGGLLVVMFESTKGHTYRTYC
jgi:hypothetical protein